MAKETSSFKEPLKCCFERTAKRMKETYGIHVWFVEIMGRRWSFMAGAKDAAGSLLPCHRIKINDRFGIVSDEWDAIPPEKREAILLHLKETVSAYE